MRKFFKLVLTAILSLIGMAALHAQTLSWFSQAGSSANPSTYTVTELEGVWFNEVKVSIAEGTLAYTDGNYVLLKTFKNAGTEVLAERDTIKQTGKPGTNGFCWWDDATSTKCYMYSPGFGSYPEAEVMYTYILPSGNYSIEIQLMRVGAGGVLTAVEGAAISHSFTVDSKVDEGGNDSQAAAATLTADTLPQNFNYQNNDKLKFSDKIETEATVDGMEEEGNAFVQAEIKQGNTVVLTEEQCSWAATEAGKVVTFNFSDNTATNRIVKDFSGEYTITFRAAQYKFEGNEEEGGQYKWVTMSGDKATLSHKFTVGAQSNLELPSDYRVTCIPGTVPKVKFSWKYVEGQQGQVRVFNNADQIIWGEAGEQEVLWEDMTAEQFEEIKDMTLRWELRAVKYDAEDFTKIIDSTSWVNCGEFVPGQQLGSNLELPDGLSYELGYGASDGYANIFFKWTKPRGEQYCQVYIYDADGKFAGKCQGQLGIASFDYQNAHFAKGTYSWKIRGVEFADDAITVLDSTEWVEATGKDVITTTDYGFGDEELDAPTGLQAVAVGSDAPAAINFMWKVSGDLLCEIEIYKDEALVETLKGQSFGEAMWTLPETGYEGVYDWKIRAVIYADPDWKEVASASEWAEGNRVTISDPWIPAPTGLDVEVNGTSATFSWYARKDLYYSFMVMGDRFMDMQEFNPLTSDGTMTYTLDNLAAGTYTWVVAASDKEYNYSDEVYGPEFTITGGSVDPGDVPAPANLAVNVTDDELLFSWDGKAGHFYAGYITDDAGEPVGMIMYPRTGGLLEEDGRVETGYPLDLVLQQVLTTDGTYHWSLQAFNANDEESEEVPGPDFYVSNGGISDACEKNVLAGVKLWPNPTAGEFNLSVPVRANVSVFGLDGKLVESRKDVEGNVRFNLNRAGLYLLSVTAGNATAVMKVVVK